MLVDQWTAAAAAGMPFDGIIGFSQGAFVAALLCEYFRQNKLILPKFVVCCSAFMRPWPLEAVPWWPTGANQISVPSLHSIGLQDNIVAKCRTEELLHQFVAAERFEH